jgi:hypothetical protein
MKKTFNVPMNGKMRILKASFPAMKHPLVLYTRTSCPVEGKLYAKYKVTQSLILECGFLLAQDVVFFGGPLTSKQCMETLAAKDIDRHKTLYVMQNGVDFVAVDASIKMEGEGLRKINIY